MAYSMADSLNQTLKIANESKYIPEREAAIADVCNKLAKLKDFARTHTAITIQTLDAFEASINAVRTETQELKNNIIASQPKELQEEFTQNINDKTPDYFYNQLKVINESIKIARDSKNLDTKISRIGVARDTLNSTREQAAQFNIDVDGFEIAEATMNEIDAAIQNGLPTSEIIIPDIPDYYSSPARELLKKATVLKKDKKYIEACEMLQNAYSSEGANDLMIEERLRLPMYLLLAGKSDDGWDELNRLNSLYRDGFSQPVIANQMRVFCKKEGKNRSPLLKPIIELKEPEVEKRNVMSFEIYSGNPLRAYQQHQDVINRLEFSVTLQLRTPLRVLLKDGAIHKDPNNSPPAYAKELWEGIWIAQRKTFRELGLDVDELPESTSASSIGYVLRGEYLPFLIAIREVVELNQPINERICKLKETLSDEKWSAFLTRHGGTDKLVSEFFPLFIETIPKLNFETIKELSKLKILTANNVTNAPDDVLLSIKDIGKAKLNVIREYCASISINRDSTRLDKVNK